MGKDYRKPAGKRFSLGPEGGWTTKAPSVDDMDDIIEDIEMGNEELANTRESRSRTVDAELGLNM